jgi:hypothetical protein
MTVRRQKEEMSRAWLAAVAGACGYALAHWTQDQDCIDATIGAPGILGGGHLADPNLDLQLKATNSPTYVRDDCGRERAEVSSRECVRGGQLLGDSNGERR